MWFGRRRWVGLAGGVALAVTAAALFAGCGDGQTAAVSGLEKSGFPADYPRPTYETTKLSIGPHEVTVEIADTAEGRRYGYMFTSELPDDRGMVFVYPEKRRMSFWMRNTRIPLDILFVDDSGRIVNAHQEMKPLRDDPSYPSAEPVRFAIELKGGWLERHGVWLRDRVTFPAELLEREPEEDDAFLGNIPVLIGPHAGS